MSQSRTLLRLASPNEHRTISREDVGFYNAVVVGAIYEVDHETIDLSLVQSFIEPLRQCVLKYPFLTVVVRDKNTDKPAYEGVSSLNLDDHISILPAEIGESGGSEMKTIEKSLPSILDRPWPADIPPWRIVVLPLTPAKTVSRCFIAFSFSHTIGDGTIGLTFHRTFQTALSESLTSTPPTKDIPTTLLPLPANRALSEPFDTPSRLTISWPYLLAPLAGAILPNFVTNLLGLRASASPIDNGTWTGAPISHTITSTETTSHIRLLEIEAALVTAALAKSRAHGAKLTAVLQQLIVRALSAALPNRDVTNFVSGTAVDMRASVGLPAGEWGLFVTGHYEVHPRVENAGILHEGQESDDNTSVLSEEMWTSARAITHNLAACAMRLQDQPIGLLRYAPSIRRWTVEKIGKRRDTSFEVSNLLAYGGHNIGEEGRGARGRVSVSKMVFAQPGNALSAPLVFNVVSVRGGSLVIAVTWQGGALGLDNDGLKGEEGV
ncbi:hypothetical protein BJX64DRAFT_246502, partial [Aspergillus heterothallicus]